MQDEHLLEEGGQVALELEEAGYRVARAKDYSWKVRQATGWPGPRTTPGR